MEDPFWSSDTRLGEKFVDRHVVVGRFARIAVESKPALLKRTQTFLQRLRERAADCHDLADRLHLGSKDTARAGKLFERPAWNLRYDIVNGGFERCRCHLGDVVRNFIEGVPNGESRRDLGDWETRGFRCQRRGSRNARIHFDNDHVAVLGIHRELNVGATRFDADSTHDSKCSVTHELVFEIGKRLCRSDSDGVAGVHTHGIDIFDRANNHTVVSVVAHDLEFVFFPTGDGRLDQNFRNGTGFESVGRNLFKLLHG